MKNKLIILTSALCFAATAIAQQLPFNTCGIVHIYDASGNRVKRIYFCNYGTDPYPAKMQHSAIAVSLITDEKDDTKTPEKMDFQQVDALYPNPTTGKFSVTFSKALQNAVINIADVTGKVIQQFNSSGYKIDFNLSSEAKGIYFIKINDDGNVIIKKVVKQ